MKTNTLYSLIPIIALIFFVSCSDDKNQLKYYKDTFELNNEIIKYESLSKLRRNMDRDPHKTKFYYSKALMLDSMCYDFFNNHFTKTPINFDEALDNYKIILDSVSIVFNTKNQFLPFEIKDINNKLQGPDSITSDNDLLLQLLKLKYYTMRKLFTATASSGCHFGREYNLSFDTLSDNKGIVISVYNFWDAVKDKYSLLELNVTENGRKIATKNQMKLIPSNLFSVLVPYNKKGKYLFETKFERWCDEEIIDTISIKTEFTR